MQDINEKITKPIIGISGYDAYYHSVVAMVTQIKSAGGEPLFLGNHANRDASEDIAKLDGLVIMGNDKDVDPSRYGQKRHPKTNSENDSPETKARSDYEFAIIELALEQKVPLMGVCAGAQKINVACGGTLHQDIEEMVGDSIYNQIEQKIPPFVPVAPVSIIADSNLAAIAGARKTLYTGTDEVAEDITLLENSIHHQAVDEVGVGLRAAAYFQNGDVQIIEAIEGAPDGKFADQFILGLQWHPEFSASDLGARIADNFVEQATKFMKQNQDNSRNAELLIRENCLSSRVPEGAVNNIISFARLSSNSAYASR